MVLKRENLAAMMTMMEPVMEEVTMLNVVMLVAIDAIRALVLRVTYI